MVAEIVLGFSDQFNQIPWRSPRAAFFFGLRLGEILHDERQHLGGVLPADEIQEFEGFVRKIQGMASVSVNAFL